MSDTAARISPVLLVLLTLLIVLTLLEGLSYIMVEVLVGKDAIYRPRALRGVENYLSARDPVLGWPSPQTYGVNALDRSGARILPAFPEPGQACVSTYGDSFVFGDEVEAVNAWSNQLALMLGCRVANYGVNGYGTDQAYLRFHGASEDESRYVVLGYFSSDIVRNINQLHNLLAPIHEIGLKPRYVIDASDTLQLLPLPSFAATQLEDVIAHPERYLNHDYFVPGGPAGVLHASFPYSLTIARALFSYKLGAVLRGHSPYVNFYDERHPSHALEITTRIGRMFFLEAAARKQSALVVMFPSRHDMESFAQSRAWIYQPLLDQLAEDGRPVVNLGPLLFEALHGRAPATIFRVLHYNEEGNRLVAQALNKALHALPGPGFKAPRAIPVDSTARP